MGGGGVGNGVGVKKGVGVGEASGKILTVGSGVKLGTAITVSQGVGVSSKGITGLKHDATSTTSKAANNRSRFIPSLPVVGA